ncbi:P-type conjugative transfer protein VirB9 [Verminephrobacter aporrectodeae subsp. tuberculatae]|uniref:P-type conjugative transfer protein VirB9 n=1 Tax=Verminephrobacter aporrectodeae TaxID=1110389 RepID=UPI0002378526|nr:P-type conjugative transfer protein VirB9 [Verminephrobacter aporrectodeae]MCW8166989.1 P-type conjugative transfer protein VirB9 [Verminephrobacter aporrectodeae subsp. tuberculatae]MCW8171169.1 P-type conjugative transfer protein VirB9 [Verminephrobacter aporrectodeae subsp. tuberculatae]
MKKLLLIGLLVPILAIAEITPPKGDYDPRVRVVDYNPMNVVKLSTFYGVSTHVQFGKSETIKDVAVGDDQAWKVIPRGNHLFIKPQATHADTNVTVITDKRTYHFSLVVQPRQVKDSTAWSDPNLIFSLAFRYPDEELINAKTEALKASIMEVKSKLSDATKEGQNIDYWVAGSDEVSPTAARDDGRFIYLTFSNNRDMPAVYSVDEQGNEALINTNVIDSNTIVVQRLVRRLILRKGSAVASVVNRSFDLNGGMDNTTGTVSPDVERVIKGAQ